ncbi:YbaB/EbfC family nucleoid-associated protein [Mycolicibacterium holsaticum]|uniref:YbaB/EbfC family nucleoid-associated protein n=1 Tax=Mycolicibacterium holsaticum TaxID=152142 RepID=UPI001E62522F|nr:YbaB/EbfC family nucleoid-associated protein [Mycolicibacterium holsaticum]MDA4108823.1 DNA-binding protein [Mycolicibacterium holsaticum DSM 44478 = JCM 12374]
MTDEMHPQVAAVLQQAQQLQSIMDEQLRRMDSQTFTATDESGTVEVTLDGHHQLKAVSLADGVMRLDVEEVQQRINEALHNAAAAASVSIEADRERIDTAVAELTVTQPEFGTS